MLSCAALMRRPDFEKKTIKSSPFGSMVNGGSTEPPVSVRIVVIGPSTSAVFLAYTQEPDKALAMRESV